MQKKTALRETLLSQRKSVSEAQRRHAGEQALRVLRESKLVAPSSVVAAYWPMRYEFDIHPIIAWLHEQHVTCALPFIVAADTALEFREYRPGDPLEQSAAFSIKQPPQAARVVTPDILFVPLAGFDRRGYRLGMGGGFYDRTLAALTAPHAAIGVGFAESEVPEIPCEPHDIRMHAILTEKELIKTLL